MRSGFKYLIAGILTGAAIMAAAGLLLRYYSKEEIVKRYIRDAAITDASAADIEEGKYDGMAAALGDPYAGYFTKEETDANKEKKSGTYEGIGVVITQDPESGAIVIVSVYPETSAEEEGIRVGDILLKVRGEDVTGLDTSEVVERIGSGEKTIDLTLVRDGEPYDVTVERRKIEVPKVASKVTEDKDGHKIGYIRITGFIYTTAEQFAKEMDSLEEQGIDGLVIDLRGNTGGLVDSAVECLDRLLPKGIVVYTLKKNGDREDYVSTGDDEIGVPVAVLVDRQTASAAEIFAGAMRDRLDAPLVGEVTFGKGIMQVTQFLNDGSSFKYTSAQYYSPDGVNINGEGFTPDIEVALDAGSHVAASEDDNQYQAAVKALDEVIGPADR